MNVLFIKKFKIYQMVAEGKAVQVSQEVGKEIIKTYDLETSEQQNDNIIYYSPKKPSNNGKENPNTRPEEGANQSSN